MHYYVVSSHKADLNLSHPYSLGSFLESFVEVWLGSVQFSVDMEKRGKFVVLFSVETPYTFLFEKLIICNVIQGCR